MGMAGGRGRSGAEGRSVGQSYRKEKDTHGLSLRALFTFEASDARLTLNEKKKSAHTGFSPTGKSAYSPETYCAEQGQRIKGALYVGAGSTSGSYRLTFGAQRTSCTLRTRRATGPREAGGTSNSRSSLSA